MHSTGSATGIWRGMGALYRQCNRDMEGYGCTLQAVQQEYGGVLVHSTGSATGIWRVWVHSTGSAAGIWRGMGALYRQCSRDMEGYGCTLQAVYIAGIWRDMGTLYRQCSRNMEGYGCTLQAV